MATTLPKKDPSWKTLTSPAPNDQPGCQNACTDQLFTAYGATMPLNEWVEFCSFTPLPGELFACKDLPSDAEYEACLAQFCPFLLPELSAVNNPSCGHCIADERPGESIGQRVLRCASTYNASDASQCLIALYPDWWWFFLFP
jgi:hypothetical protein